MKRIRTVIGLFLIAAAIAGFIYWELAGRETVLMDTFLVANETILPGTVVKATHFAEAGILTKNQVEGAIAPHRLSEIVGKVAVQRIIKNDQIVAEYFLENDFYLINGESIFVLKPEWITMRSSSLRRGDWVDIYEDRENSLIGRYRVAFVKDSNEIEVQNSENGGQSILDRVNSTSVISHIEIITDLPGFQKIVEKVEGVIGSGLLLVQREEGYP
ncbi:MAG: hypothetical protein PHE41_09035 [Eubacteriales bacterium]|nr:hypothetical protein [Eubacteriales bacterium]